MPEHFKPILSLLQRFPDSKVQDLHKKLKEDISRGAVHNRLDDLVKAKLVKRRRVGKFFKYSLSK